MFLFNEIIPIAVYIVVVGIQAWSFFYSINYTDRKYRSLCLNYKYEYVEPSGTIIR